LAIGQFAYHSVPKKNTKILRILGRLTLLMRKGVGVGGEGRRRRLRGVQGGGAPWEASARESLAEPSESPRRAPGGLPEGARTAEVRYLLPLSTSKSTTRPSSRPSSSLKEADQAAAVKADQAVRTSQALPTPMTVTRSLASEDLVLSTVPFRR
jgi:hypothetical protein